MSNSTANSSARMKVSGLLLGLALVATAAIPAAAQEVTGANAAMTVTTTPVSFSVGDATSANFALPADVSFDAQAPRAGGATAPPAHQMGGKQVTLVVQGGLISDFDTGVVVGVGGSFLPMKDNDKIEIIADANFVHFGGASGVYISGNGAYDVHLQNSKAVPFLGAGIGIVHASENGFSNTNTNLQLLGGVKFETKSGRALEGQVRFVLGSNGDGATLVLVGFAF